QLRLILFLELYPYVLLKNIQKQYNTFDWFKNDWIVLIAINPETKKQYLFENEQFTERNPVNTTIPKIDHLELLFEKKSENIPSLILNH
ncbi:MAG: hypothetical protein ACOVQ2_02160, partial [Flavobacterium sp.]